MPTPEALALVDKLRKIKSGGLSHVPWHELNLFDAAKEIDRFAAQRGATDQYGLLEGEDVCQLTVTGVWSSGGEAPAYDDEISAEQIAAMNRIVPDAAFADCETISGPAWGGGNAGERARAEDLVRTYREDPATLITAIVHYLRSSHREGAEAMREECAKTARGPGGHDECDHVAGYMDGRLDAALAIEALPIPGKTDAG